MNQGPGGSGTGKAELTTTAPFFRPFFSTSRASVLFLLRKLHAVNPQIYFFFLLPFTYLFCVSVMYWLTA